MSEQAIKRAVRRRDGFRCRDCGITQAEYAAKCSKQRVLEVHRTTPGSRYTIDGTVALCKRCHKRRHMKPKPEAKLSFETDDVTRNAIRIRCAVETARQGRAVFRSEVVCNILREALADELAEIDKYAVDEASEPAKPTRRKTPAPKEA